MRVDTARVALRMMPLRMHVFMPRIACRQLRRLHRDECDAKWLPFAVHPASAPQRLLWLSPCAHGRRRMRWRQRASPTAVPVVAWSAIRRPGAEKLLSAVVNISTSQTLKGPTGVPLPSVPKGSPFEDFFEDFFNREGRRLPPGAQGVVARLRLRDRRQGRSHRHQQSRHRRCRRDRRQLSRRLAS